MEEIFGNLEYDDFCGLAWVESPVTRYYGVKVASTDGNCYCRPGEYFEPPGDPSNSQFCHPCTENMYSFGGYQRECLGCQNLESDFYCEQGVRTVCPDLPGLVCYQGVRFVYFSLFYSLYNICFLMPSLHSYCSAPYIFARSPQSLQRHFVFSNRVRPRIFLSW